MWWCVSGQLSVWLVCVTLGVVGVRDGGGVSGSGYEYLVSPSVESLFLLLFYLFVLFCLQELSGR